MNSAPGLLQEMLLGYDVREMFGISRDAWTPLRRECALLLQDVDMPLSVDRSVWFPVVEIIKEQTGGKDYIEKNIPSWIGRHMNIWAALGKLQRFRQSIRDQMPERYWIIAITICNSPSLMQYFADTSGQDRLIHLGEAMPLEIDPRWQLLGYDVADAARYSGLLNCYYCDHEEQAGMSHHAVYLNEWHLFVEKARAAEFCAITDARVPEHAPFFVYGIYRVGDQDSIGD
jgi:hypothetical protein